MRRRLMMLAAFALLVGGCGGNLDPTGPAGSDLQQARSGVLPPGAVLDSARLVIHVLTAGGPVVSVHPHQTPWDEPTVAWDDVGSGLSPFVVATFEPIDTGSLSVNVTGMVSLWLDSIWVNHGLIMDQNQPNFLPTAYGSREAGAAGPRLELFCSGPSVPPLVVLSACADAYVNEDDPQAAAGGRDSVLYSGSSGSATGENRTLIRFDFSEPEPVSSLGDRVWDDLDADGIQAAGEPGVAAVGVRLLDCAGATLAVTETDSSGYYRFDSLLAGSYVVEFVPPTSYVFSAMTQGADPALDSDADPTTGRTACIDVTGTADVWSVDAGMYVPVAPDSSVCTHGKGYWKHHARGGDTAMLASLLPLTLGGFVVSTPADAFALLQPEYDERRGKWIGKLLSHMLAAKLNVAAGANGDAVAEALSEADAFLAERGTELWSEVERRHREQVHEWKEIFEDYNEGEIGPGSCDGDDDEGDEDEDDHDEGHERKRGDRDVDHGRAEDH